MPEVALVAEDGCVPLDILAFIAAAVDLQMRRDVAKVYDTGEPWTVGALSSLRGLADAPGVRKVLTFRRKLSAGGPGTLGFHTQAGGVDYAEALPPRLDLPIIDATTASHEVVESYVDPGCDQSWPMPDGARVDFEVCDPCESDRYLIQVTLGRQSRLVAVSNFVTPAWFGLGDEPFDQMGLLRQPFSTTAGGYYRVTDIGGSEDFVYADERARASVAAKLGNRTSRLVTRARPR